MMDGRHNSVMSLYTVPPAAVPVVITAVPTAVYTFSLFSSDACARQAPPSAFVIYTPQGPMVSFPVGAYPGRSNAGMNMGYPNPVSALPTPVVGGPTASTVHSASTLSSVLPTASSLPLPTVIATATITTATAAVTGSVVDSVSSKLATGLEFLTLDPRPASVEIHSSRQVLSVSVAAPPTALPFAATTPATDQLPGNATAVTTAEPASTAATVAASTAPPKLTVTSSAVPITSTTTPAVVISRPITTSTVVSSSSSTGVAVAGSSGSNPPGSTYVLPTQSVTPPVVSCTVKIY